MLQGSTIIAVSLAYLGLLFAIAHYGDKGADRGRSLIANPTIYALSLAVYCTTWTFYGSVGRAAATGIGFLPIYLGPTLIAALWWWVLVKMIRIAKANRITSIADFVASRYGKSQLLGGLVTVIAVIGIIPYISLQLKAVSNSFSILLGYPEIIMPSRTGELPIWRDTSLLIALAMAAFTIVFGTRHLDATERHEGMVAAIAFESIVKLIAFSAVGLWVTFGLFDGFGDIFNRAAANPDLARLMQVSNSAASYGSWASLTLLSMLSVMFLPRQFQIAVVENVNEDHVRKAIWLFPLYLLLINIFVLPIALGGLLHFSARWRGRRYLRSHPADGKAAGGAGAAGIHRRSVGGDRHGDRRNHRLVHHGLQRPRDAAAPAQQMVPAASACRPVGPAAGDPPRRHTSSSCCSATSTSVRQARPMRWSASG